MKLLIIGAGGVGTSAAMILKLAGKEAAWAEKVILADYDFSRAKKVAALCAGPRFAAEWIDARDGETIGALIRKHGINFVMNAVDPGFNKTIFDTCLENGAGYLDCALSASVPDPEKPFERVNVKLGDYQFARHEAWKEAGITAIVGSGVEPGMSDVFVRFASDRLFDTIDEVNIRDGDNYTGGGFFGFSVITTIEECLSPPIVWEKGRGWFTTERFSEPEIFSFPGGIGNREVVNVEHEEVVLVPRVIDCNRVTFKYGLPQEFRKLLLNLESVHLTDNNIKIIVGGEPVSPREFLVKVLPSPVESSGAMTGRGCAGAWITGDKDGKRRSVYIYQLADNQECVKKYTTNSVVAQTAVGPVIMMELIDKGIWNLKGVYGPESFDPGPFMERLEKYGFPAGMREMDSEYAEAQDRRYLSSMFRA
ncbi:MAG: saccharopine dehydrogenase NADP-binding domain-containing protein [Spirochaetaceae bacterium]|jgi:saccharopine dehydrogenase-like NADP-dependent oxidoreductase|nr:saccharopine dehydrogenase NADP-binding domain-containing protein [Spirochaetaceae bacterium]